MTVAAVCISSHKPKPIALLIYHSATCSTENSTNQPATNKQRWSRCRRRLERTWVEIQFGLHLFIQITIITSLSLRINATRTWFPPPPPPHHSISATLSWLSIPTSRHSLATAAAVITDSTALIAFAYLHSNSKQQQQQSQWNLNCNNTKWGHQQQQQRQRQQWRTDRQATAVEYSSSSSSNNNCGDSNVLLFVIILIVTRDGGGGGLNSKAFYSLFFYE